MVELTDDELVYLALVNVLPVGPGSWVKLDPVESTEEIMQERLRCRGLLDMKYMRRPFVDSMKRDVVYEITEEGRQLLGKVPAGRIASLCSNYPRAIILDCIPRLTLEELPEFLTHELAVIRKLSWVRYRELTKWKRYKQLFNWKKLPSLIRRGVRSWMGGK